MEVSRKPWEMLEKLAEALRFDLSKADDYAFKRRKKTRREEAIVRYAQYEEPKGVFLLLLLYFYTDISKVKRVLGYADRNPSLSRSFFRELLWKYADAFFEETTEPMTIGNKTLDGEVKEKNYCIFCGKKVKLEAYDKHHARYEHLVIHHFRQLLVTNRDFAGLSEEEKVKKLQALRRYLGK